MVCRIRKKIFTSDREFVSRIYRELKKLMTKKTNTQLNSGLWGMKQNREFSKE